MASNTELREAYRLGCMETSILANPDSMCRHKALRKYPNELRWITISSFNEAAYDPTTHTYLVRDNRTPHLGHEPMQNDHYVRFDAIVPLQGLKDNPYVE